MSADQPPTPTFNVSETPRTDAAIVESILCTEGGDEECTVYPCVEHVESDFARQLERELTAALARAEKAEEDTRRLDWLEHDMIRLLQYSEPDSDGSNYQIEYFSRPGRKTVQSTSIRAAIDAALTPTKEPTP